MSRRYYPSTRERITRAMNDGVKSGGEQIAPDSRYSRCNSGRPLRRAFYRGFWLARGEDITPHQLRPVDLSGEFADMIREVEAAA